MSLSFIRGMVAAVNPCGFILLPTYLMYFLGMQGAAPGTQRATMRRALLVSLAVSAGFLSVFLVAGVISYNFTNWINENAKYATGAIGLALLVLGIAMLFGYKLPFMTPTISTGDTPERTMRAMFVFGIAYAVASIGCTIGLFIATVFSTTAREGVVAGVGNVLAYGAGMALLVSALTVALASANTSLLKFLRGSLQYVDRIAAGFVVLSGTVPPLVLLLGRHQGRGRSDHRLGARAAGTGEHVPERPLADRRRRDGGHRGGCGRLRDDPARTPTRSRMRRGSMTRRPHRPM